MVNFIKKNQKILFISFLFVFVIVFLGKAFFERNKMLGKYEDAIDKITNKKYQEAQDIFYNLGDYKDSLKYIKITENGLKYEEAMELYKEKNYKKAQKQFEELDDFEESELYAQKSKEYYEKEKTDKEEKKEKKNNYNEAKKLYNSQNYQQSKEIFESLDNYKDSNKLAKNCQLKLLQLKYSNTISAGIRCSSSLGKNKEVFASSDDDKIKEKIETWGKKNIISIAVNGELAIGLKNNGKVVHAGKVSGYRIETKTWDNIISVCAGERYLVGLKSDGKLVAQGHNGDNQIDIDNWKNIIAIDTGWRHTVGLDKNGKIFITGYKSKSQLDQIKKHKDEWINIVDISAGGGSGGKWGINETGHTVALRADHSVVAVGDNSMGQCEVYGDDWKDIIAISAGDFHTVGLKSDGTVVTTQDKNTDSAKKIKKWTNIVAVSAGYGITLGLKSDGTVVATGYNKNNQINIDDWGKAITHKEEWMSIFNSN